MVFSSVLSSSKFLEIFVFLSEKKLFEILGE